MKIAGSALLLAFAVLWTGCTIVTMRPVPVGVSSPDEGSSSSASAASAFVPRPLQTTPTGFRGMIVFPIYRYLNLPRDVEAEVWIDGILVGRVRAGSRIVYEASAGTHTFLSRVYGSGRQGQEELYLGCSSDRFEVDPRGFANAYGIFWQLNLPPPSPMC